MYGANGWVLHHNTDLWRIAGPVDGFWGFSPTCGAWLTMNLFETYLFNGDKQYLEELYPILKEASVFFLETLWEKPETGELMVSPASSPENTPFDGLFLFEGTTMSTQNVFILFSNTIKAANDLGIDREFVIRLEEARQKLPPMKIGKHTQLQEWYEDWDRIEDHHRHNSHLLGLYPGNMISPFKTPELFEAVRNSLEYRTDISTGWSMGWRVCLWARLLDGNRAMKLLKNQLTPIGENHGQGEHSGGTYPNLFDAHPPFQIDGNFGCTAGIAEMLIQSHDEAVFVLPALPDALKTGSFKGVKARGGFEFDMEWSDGKITSLKAISHLGGNLRLRFIKTMLPDSFALDMKEASCTNENPFFRIYDFKKPIVSENARLNGLHLKPVSEYDLETQAGKEYIICK
jgi:alpha-L-fucosidase 2